MMNKIKPEPCPICGGAAEVWVEFVPYSNEYEYDETNLYHCGCKECGLEETCSWDEAPAIRWWNEKAGPVNRLKERLAAYEDTGLEPEEISTVQECLVPIPFGRFHDIMKAERDGRLVLLPCKIDTPIYLLRSKKEPRKPTKYWVEEYDIDHFTIGGAMIPMITACNKENEWEELIDGTLEGAEFFLSREAAEKAIAKEAGK